MGTEADVDGIVGQEQAGALDVLHGIQGDGSIGERRRTASRHRRRHFHGTIEPFGAGGEVQGVQIEGRTAAFVNVGHDVYDRALQVDDAGAEDAYLILNIAVLAEQHGRGDGRSPG